MTNIRRLAADRSGAAAVEMVLVIPIFVVLIFGTFELGHYFLSEHVVQKSVRDAARYAARLPITNYPGCAVSPAAETAIQNVARTGDPGGTQARRLSGWTSATMTTVTLTCDTTGYYKGVYSSFPGGAPVVTVSAVVPYPMFFATMGLGTATAAKCLQNPTPLCLTLGARSQSAVFGA